MTVLDALDAAAVRRWCEDAVAALAAARTSIDDLNVYPVPDGDTGTNLVLTMNAVVEAVRTAGDGARPLPEVCRAVARGALLGARGNSGAILAQLLRGLTDVLAASEPVRGRELQAALRRAADLAHASVQAPVEGTVLTVARAAADAAAAADPASLADVAGAAARGAAAALARTPDQLDVHERVQQHAQAPAPGVDHPGGGPRSRRPGPAAARPARCRGRRGPGGGQRPLRVRGAVPPRDPGG